jgi:hypothetical protein
MKKIFTFLIFCISLPLSNLHPFDAFTEDEVFRSLADTLSKVEKKIVNKTVAVYGFEVIGRPGDNYAVFATEKLTHLLVSNGTLTVIERSRIDQVLKEQSLSMTGIMDSGTAAKIGQILSVDAVIIGTIHVTEKNIEFFARVIQSEKGIILASADKKLAVGMKPLEPLKPLKPIESSQSLQTLSEPEVKSNAKAPGLKALKSFFTTDEQVSISYSDLPGNDGDWITLTKVSDPDNTYGDWFYTSGKKSGTYSFNPVGPGIYEVRLYFNWPNGGYVVQKRLKITVK